MRGGKGDWVGGGGVMPGSLPKEVASVAHKMQHGSFLTPRLRGKFNTVEEVFLALSSGKNRSWNFAPKWCLRTRVSSEFSSWWLLLMLALVYATGMETCSSQTQGDGMMGSGCAWLWSGPWIITLAPLLSVIIPSKTTLTCVSVSSSVKRGDNSTYFIGW